ncbi:DUF4870 domain-containing protein [Pedobacter sp. ASV28]|uniref:DUF4870 domain-containing protein n=1 Tax=Pedobacter sp. ASV28 TaxID=2795123 RepID=UPI0018ED7C61|nr:DUF4870 domain-containing protein [Pedobacter sp. ASV28]
MMKLNENSTIVQEKTTAVISYLTIVGWLIAYFTMHKEHKTNFSSFHLRQSLLLMIVAIALGWMASSLMQLVVSLTDLSALYSLTYLIQLGIFVLWLIGLIGAAKGEKKPIPVIGEFAQRIFPGV